MDEWREIEVRGHKMLVSADGEVHLPEKRTTYTYVRLGKPATKTAVFKERRLKASVNNMGYLEVCFVHNRKTYKHLVHRLVALAFVDGYEDGLVVRHKDGDKMNNTPPNLEWVSKARSSAAAWERGLIPLRGEGQPTSKLSEAQVRCIRRLLDKGVSANSLAVVAGVSSSLIYLIRDGKRWAHLDG